MRTLIAAVCLGSATLIGAACGDDPSGAEGSGGSSASGDPSSSSAGGGSASTSSGGGSASSGSGGGAPDCSSIKTFEDGLVPSKELHVATNGSDASGDGTSQKPFATIQHAAGLATPGTAVRIHAGTYSSDSYIADLSGQAGAPIWIGGAPGEDRPVLDGGNEALHFTRARYVIVHDLEVRNAQDNGINADDGGDYANAEASRYVIFRGLYVHDIGSGGNQDCIKLSGLNDYFVLDSELSVCGGSGSGSAIDHVGCHKGLIARNHVHTLEGTGIQTKGGSEDIELRWNRFEDAGERPLNMGGSTDFQFFRPPLSMAAPNVEARNIRVVANVIKGGYCTAAFVGCDGCVFANNTVVDPENWFFRILQETVSNGGYQFVPAQNGKIVNNIFYFNRATLSGEDINTGANTAPNTFTVSNNLWFAHDNPGASAPKTLPAPETGSVVGQDPMFPSKMDDYHIAPTSPAAGKGAEPAGAQGDLDEACYATPPSIGAYEAK